MGSFTDYIFDTSLLEEALAFLQNDYGINAVVVDSEGETLPISQTGQEVLTADRFVPFAFQEDIGGIRFSAADEATLTKATDAINLCSRTMDVLLERELELQQTSDEMLQLSEQLNFLFHLSQKVIGVSKIETFCAIILEEIANEIMADFAFVVTSGKWDEEMLIAHNVALDRVSSIQKEGNLQEASREGTVIFSLDDGTSVLLAPLMKKEGINGYLAFFRLKEQRFFTAYEKKFVSIIEHIISPSVETLKLYDSLQELYLNTVKALAAAIDAKDEYTHGHSFRVAEFSVAIGRQMAIPEKMLQHLEIAAYMHDLGKIGVSESILGKPGKLTEEEYEEIKKHPTLTNKILQPIRLPAFIVDAAVQHHERLDGRGYPLGLKGDKISQFAKVIAVADVFDAMTSKRPYRDAMSVEKALKVICNGIDSEFDRTSVIALLASLKNQGVDKPLAHISSELKFEDFVNLNNFLLELTALLTENRCEPLLSTVVEGR